MLVTPSRRNPRDSYYGLEASPRTFASDQLSCLCDRSLLLRTPPRGCEDSTRFVGFGGFRGLDEGLRSSLG